MCGIFFLFDRKKTGADLEDRYGPVAREALQFRGPDGAFSLLADNCFALHSLLSITGSTRQPCRWRNGFFLFNGEIYNDWESYSSAYGDADFLTHAFNSDGCHTVQYLDGEFALVACDESQNTLHIVSDPFGTKPVYYSIEEDRVGVATFDYVLTDCGFNQCQRVPANTWITVDLNSRSVSSRTLIEFDFLSTTKDNYTDFGEAFSKAIQKRAARANRKIHVPLSSGHDSGLIAAELVHQDISF